MNWWDALNQIAKDFPEDDPYIQRFRSGMYGKSNALFDSIKQVQTVPSLPDVWGTHLDGNVELSKMAPIPLQVLLHEGVHAASRPTHILHDKLKPEIFDPKNRDLRELFTDTMANKLFAAIRGESGLPSSLDALVSLLLNTSPLETGTRAGTLTR